MVNLNFTAANLIHVIGTCARTSLKGICFYIRDLSFLLCVCGAGGVNFEGGTEKSRFDKGGNKVWPKYGKGRKESRIRPGGIRFFII